MANFTLFFTYVCFLTIFPCFDVTEFTDLSLFVAVSFCVVCPRPFYCSCPPVDEAPGLFPGYCCYKAAMHACMQIAFLPSHPCHFGLFPWHIVFPKVEWPGQRFYSSYYTFTSLPFVTTEPVYSADLCFEKRTDLDHKSQLCFLLPFIVTLGNFLHL